MAAFLKTINGITYYKYKYDNPKDDCNIWRPVEDNERSFICDCGSTSFQIFYPMYVNYRVNAQCTNCGKVANAYTG